MRWLQEVARHGNSVAKVAREAVATATDCLMTCLLRVSGMCAGAAPAEAAALLSAVEGSTALDVLHFSLDASMLVWCTEALQENQPSPQLQHTCNASAALCATAEFAFPAGTVPVILYRKLLRLPSEVVECICRLQRSQHGRCTLLQTITRYLCTHSCVVTMLVVDEGRPVSAAWIKARCQLLLNRCVISIPNLNGPI